MKKKLIYQIINNKQITMINLTITYIFLFILTLWILYKFYNLTKELKKVLKRNKRVLKRSRNIQPKTERERFTKKLSDKLIKKHLPKDWCYRLNNTKSRLGQTCYHKKEINISKLFINGKYGTDEEIKDTILHEIGHSLDLEKNGGVRKSKNGRRLYHDKVWKKIAMDIGCNGKTCGKM
jgi:hypothetical protein